MNYLAAFLETLKAPAPTVGPLRELFFDDSDATFWTIAGWTSIPASGWPGGLRNNTLTYCDAVHSGESVQITTRSFYTTGSVDEGLVLDLANEGGGPLAVYLDGNLVTTLGGVSLYNALTQYCYDMRRQGYNDSGTLAQGNGNSGFTDTPTFSKGWHTVTLVKAVNAAAGDNGNSNRRSYFDGGSVFTRSTTFS